MNEIHFAIFETALLCSAGSSANTAFEKVANAYAEWPMVTTLFTELKSSDVTTVFEARLAKDPAWMIATAFAKKASETGEIELYWKNSGYGEIIRNKIRLGGVTDADVQFAREIFGIFSIDHPVMTYLFSLKPGSAAWNAEVFMMEQESMGFDSWLANSRLPLETPPPLRTRLAIDECARKIASPDMARDAQRKWDRFASTLVSLARP